MRLSRLCLAATLSITGICCTARQSATLAAEPAKPLEVLYITGGCCHDYDAQKKVITEGLAKRARINCTVVHEGGESTDHKLSIYSRPNWSQGYDVVFHNECFADVKDPEFLRLIVAEHEKGTPAVLMHCAMHCYRAGTDDWFKFVGITSPAHDARYEYSVNVVDEHPIVKGLPRPWDLPKDELYFCDKVWDTARPLAVARSRKRDADQTVIWTNQYGKARVFGTTIGHYTHTVELPEFLDMMTRGTLWAAGKLQDDGTPVPELALSPTAVSAAKSKPFRASPARIPGVVEAEDFDTGDAGVAYHDRTEKNQGADYRGPTQVDIERRGDASNGHGIGWVLAGEWVNYTVEAADSGPYTLEIPVASAKAGGRFHVEFDGRDATGPITIPDTGAWTKLETIRVEGVRVPVGVSVMKVVMDADGPSGGVGDIDCFRFSRVTDASAPPRPQ